MKSMVVAGFLALSTLVACANPFPSASVTAQPPSFPSASAAPSASSSQPVNGVIGTAEQAAVAAERMTTIAGPWTIGDVQHGTYERLWQGSTNDMSGQGTADRARKAARIVWRVDVTG